MSAIDALCIFDECHVPILEHAYAARPPTTSTLLSLYLAHPAPRPPLIYLPQTAPPTLLYTITRDNLLFAAPSSNASAPPLVVLELLHRAADALADFLGSPLLASKIQGSYDTVAQLCAELADGGFVATTEPNALRDLVDAPNWMRNLLGGVGLPSSSPSLSLTNTGSGSGGGSGLAPPSSSRSSSPGPPSTSNVPWRRSNVRHTSNELYVDVIETLRVLHAPSGRPLQAVACGSIVFTAKVSGVPDLLLTMSTAGGGRAGVVRTMDLPVFHPCVRLGRWRSAPGELSFVPPDGRFVLVGYECDLLGESGGDGDSFDAFFASSGKGGGGTNRSAALNLPASLEVVKSLGPTGADFEVRLTLSPRFRSSAPGSSSSSSAMSSMASSYQPGGATSSSPAASSLASNLGRLSHSGTSAQPTLEALTVTVPIPTGVRNLTDLKTSRGEATYAPGDRHLEWKLGSKETGPGTATLRCSVVGVTAADDNEGGEAGAGGEVGGGGRWSYDEDEGSSYQASGLSGSSGTRSKGRDSTVETDEATARRKKLTAQLMPSAALLSFQVKGWLASGLKVESLVVNTKASRGLGAGVTPYKGVKYMTVSDGGVEIRC